MMRWKRKDEVLMIEPYLDINVNVSQSYILEFLTTNREGTLFAQVRR